MKFYWGRAVIAGVLAEASMFAIVFPVLHFWGQTAFLASILIGSALMPFLFALWACKPATSRFTLHGLLVGIVAAVVYLIIAHGLKLLGGSAGGLVAAVRKRLVTQPAT